MGLLLWVFSGIIGISSNSAVFAAVVDESYPTARKVQFGYTLQNTTDRLSHNIDFWTYAPVKQTSTQYCLSIEASHPFQLITDKSGNQVLHFTLNSLPPYASRIITIQANLLLSKTPRKISETDLDSYLKPEKYIESDHPEIRQTAHKLNASSTLETAGKFHSWIVENIKYTGYSSQDFGAFHALKSRSGDCSEFMTIFVALCRATDIYARGVAGYICNKNSILDPNSYHNWCEFYIDGAWRIADPQRKQFMQNQDQYIAMRIIEHNKDNPMGPYDRFRFIGKGIRVKMKSS
jgi:transglutaminase-like putative cysteine protease